MPEDKSILKEALTSYKEIMDAANIKAAERLSNEFPEKFNEYLKEEINKKNTNESASADIEKESKKLDEGDKKKNETMKEKTKETQEGVKEEKIDETKETQEGVKEEKIDETKETQEGVDETKETDKTKKRVNESDEYQDEIEDEIDMLTKELGADIPDEDKKYLEKDRDEPDFSFEDLEEEISKMEDIEKELEERDDSVAHTDSVSYIDKNKGGVAFHELVKIKNMIEEMLGGYDDDSKPEEPVIDETSETNEADQDILTDEDIDSVLSDDDIDEHHGITHAARKKVTSKLPRKGQGLPKSHEPQLRYAMQEAENKIKNLIDSNKKTTRSLNENKKKIKVLGELVEGYKGALEKYRDQLKSMAVFNTNLAHVNNILVDDDLALTKEDKINVINEFKKIDSITKSEEKYNKLITEMKERKKERIDENLDEKLNKKSSIGDSSKKVLDEVIEKTAYENDEHLNKIKRMNEYLDKRAGKKRIE